MVEHPQPGGWLHEQEHVNYLCPDPIVVIFPVWFVSMCPLGFSGAPSKVPGGGLIPGNGLPPPSSEEKAVGFDGGA